MHIYHKSTAEAPPKSSAKSKSSSSSSEDEAKDNKYLIIAHAIFFGLLVMGVLIGVAIYLRPNSPVDGDNITIILECPSPCSPGKNRITKEFRWEDGGMVTGRCL